MPLHLVYPEAETRLLARSSSAQQRRQSQQRRHRLRGDAPGEIVVVLSACIYRACSEWMLKGCKGCKGTPKTCCLSQLDE